MDVGVFDLWLAILVSSAVVFIASSILHMVIPIHKGDFKKLSGEENLLESFREQGVAPGAYMFPCPDSMKDMGSPEMLEKYNKGPVGWMMVLPNGPPAMGKSLIQWFLFSVLIGVFTAYMATLAGLRTGAEYSLVFRITGTVSILGYAVSNITDSIWKGVSWGTTLKFIFDGLVYGLLTAGVFGWLWPA